MDVSDEWTGYVSRVPKCLNCQPRLTIPEMAKLLPFNPSVQGRIQPSASLLDTLRPSSISDRELRTAPVLRRSSNDSVTRRRGGKTARAGWRRLLGDRVRFAGGDATDDVVAADQVDDGHAVEIVAHRVEFVVGREEGVVVRVHRTAVVEIQGERLVDPHRCRAAATA